MSGMLYGIYRGPNPELSNKTALLRAQGVNGEEGANKVWAQFDDTSLPNSLGFGWHEYPADHWSLMVNAREKSIRARILQELTQKLDNVPPIKDPEGLTLEHASWMLHNMPNALDVPKSNKWIGYLQALLAVHKVLSMTEARTLNRKAINHGL